MRIVEWVTQAMDHHQRHNLTQDTTVKLAGREPGAWTRAELELLHDRELDGDKSRALEESLVVDAELRACMSRVREVDSLAVQALLSRSGRRSTGAMGGLRLAGLAIAALALGVGAWIWTRPDPGVPRDAMDRIAVETATPERVPEPARVPAQLHSSVKVVFVLALGDEPNSAIDEADADDQSVDGGDPMQVAADAAADTPAAAHVPVSASATVASFEKSLARGDVAGGAELIAAADESSRDEVYERLAAVLLSANTASQVLDRLPGDVAIDLCRTWLKSGAQRPLAIKHLSRRAQDGALRDRVHIALHDLLEEKPELRPWMVSYANWAVTTPPPTKAHDGAWMDGWFKLDVELADTSAGGNHVRGGQRIKA